jgi:hypothetical protein
MREQIICHGEHAVALLRPEGWYCSRCGKRVSVVDRGRPGLTASRPLVAEPDAGSARVSRPV